jgi:hypothetical protein
MVMMPERFSNMLFDKDGLIVEAVIFDGENYIEGENGYLEFGSIPKEDAIEIAKRILEWYGVKVKYE